MLHYEKPRTAEQNRKLWSLANELCYTPEDMAALAYSYSDQRTQSTKELTLAECNRLLEYMAGEAAKQQKGREKMRNKIIHLLCTLAQTPMVDEQGKADYERINAYIQEIGSNNPKKKILNYLYYNELLPVLNQVEAMHTKQLKNSK